MNRAGGAETNRASIFRSARPRRNKDRHTLESLRSPMTEGHNETVVAPRRLASRTPGEWLLVLATGVAVVLGLAVAVADHAELRARERQTFTDCRTAILDRDEGNYMRMADKIRRGERPTDDVYDSVSYRSVLFSLAAVPAISKLGCTGKALETLRTSVLGVRLLIPFAAFALLALVGGDGRLEKGCLAMVLLAWNSQLTSSSYFLPDVPSALLVLLCLSALASARRPLAGLGAGALMAVAVLVKADFLYVFLAVLAIRLAFAWRRRSGMAVAALTLAGYLAGLGAWAVRNYTLTGSLFVTSKDSVVLWIGNDAEARAHGYRYHPVAIPREVEAAHAGEPVEVWGREYFGRLLRERVVSHPFEVAKGVATKAWLYLTNSGENNFSSLGLAGIGLGWAVNGLALLAAVLWVVRRWPGDASPAQADLVLAWASAFAILAATIFEARYMVHVLTLASVLAAWFAVDGLRRLGARRRSRTAG